MIDTTTNFVEHQNLVVQRLKNFTNIVGNERVIGSSDCGFGTFAGFGTIDPDIAYEKLKVLAEGAEHLLLKRRMHEPNQTRQPQQINYTFS